MATKAEIIIKTAVALKIGQEPSGDLTQQLRVAAQDTNLMVTFDQMVIRHSKKERQRLQAQKEKELVQKTIDALKENSTKFS